MSNQHGGARPGAGRPRGKGKYQEETKPVRVPISRVEDVRRYLSGGKVRVPLYASSVRAGFPSPADDYLEDMLDLNEYLVPSPHSTFMVRARGDSMQGASILDGDLLVVDKGIMPKAGMIVIVAVDAELTVKRLDYQGGLPVLLPENPAYAPIVLPETASLVVWGVVTHVIHTLR